MVEVKVHPNAYIPYMRNRKAGLIARTLILRALDKERVSINTLLSETKLSQSSLRYHLKLLEEHKLIKRVDISGRRGKLIESTGLGQQPIIQP
jgi:DNA-binding transcriptional ArsR family regulator